MGVERMIALNPRLNKEQNRAFVKECPLPDYDTLPREVRLDNLAKRINDSHGEEEQRRLKGYLPFRCPHYTRLVMIIGIVSISWPSRSPGRPVLILTTRRRLNKPT